MNTINWQERINQMLSTGQKKSYFTVGMTILFVVVMSIIGVIPALSSLGSQAEDNAKRDAIIEKLDTKLASLKTLTISQDSQTDLIDYFNNIMPDDYSQDDYINLIISLAKKDDVKVAYMNFERDNLDLNIKTSVLVGERVIPQYLSVSVSGDRTATLKFMGDVESSARILNINNFVLNRVPEYNSAGVNIGTTYNLTIKLIIYYFK